MIDTKLQLKDGQTIAVVGENVPFELAAQRATTTSADAVLVFATNSAQLEQYLELLNGSAEAGKIVWIAYPKARKLATDINRDIIREITNKNGLDTVRQIAIDETWSALRLKRYTS
ncbi:MAG TPA: hypothetical protein VMB52_05595 [Verrucomicrobiae bacterium]|nr:hypothetical protein [Verrucomicrobiae bacterium]